MAAPTSAPPPTVTGGAFKRLFTSNSDVDFIGRSGLWLRITVVVVIVAALGVGVRGLNFSIDFTGGTAFLVENATAQIDVDALRGDLLDLGIEEVNAQTVGDPVTGAGALVTTPEIGEIGGAEQTAARELIAQHAGVAPGDVLINSIGPRWGAAVTEQALLALAVFLGLVVLYITLRFEWRAAVAALATLIHDVVVTIGIYALLGFQVSPSSVIALLTILGYSLYDTIVVFDRVREDTKPLAASTASSTYGEVANTSLNSVLLRSLSTSITSLLPVGCLLLIGANLLGADTLSDLAIALFIGMAIGTYSSITIATPLLVWLKEKEPKYRELKERIVARRGGAAAAALATSGEAKSPVPRPSRRDSRTRSKRKR